GETKRDFYAEKPITVQMFGDYHQFGDFISRIAALPRVVILEVTEIAPEAAPAANQRGRTPVRRRTNASVAPGDTLRLQGTIRTFRYLDESEQARLEAENAAAAAPARRR